MSTEKTLANPPQSRPTIGVLVDTMISGYQVTLWRGIKAAAQDHEINLICFLGREIDSTFEHRKQANAVYRWARESNIDGLIFLTGTISHFVDQAGLQAFFRKFSPRPCVSIAAEVENIPSILLDNSQGICDMMAHLIEDHHYQKIGFVRMREGHEEGDARFEAYQDSLKKYGLPYDPDLVVPGKLYDMPEAIVSLLYDERKVSPEAIVVVDDYMALPIIENLEKRGIAVPRDVAVVGFDDIEETRYIEPPLTTLRQPLLSEARQAVEMILNMLQGGSVPLKIERSPSLIIRQSCGCLPTSLTNAALPPLSAPPMAESLAASQDRILASILESAEFSNKQPVRTWLEALIRALENSEPDFYLQTLNQILQQTEQEGEDILAWQAVVSALRPFVLSILQAKPELSQAENLLQQTRVMIAEYAQRSQAIRRLKIQALNLTFRNLSQALNTTIDFNDLLNVLEAGLPPLGITEFYISTYDQNNPETDRLRLVLAYTRDGRVDLPPDGLTYPAEQLLPSGYLDRNQQFAKLVEPLYFRDEQYGFVVFEAQSFDESIYDALAEQISSGLKGTSLVQQVEQRALQLQTASEVSQATSSILEPEDLIHQTVDLVRSRFGLYYVGLFLADEERQWAVLRAGTGEPGQKMLSENWRLEIGGGSMIGRCVATGIPDIQLDIDKAPVHLRNPYLPETKSELALPLISRGEILGALTIQSKMGNAFSTEDISVFQTMAGQLANAIGNAYLYDALAREQYLMNALMDNMPEAIYFKDRESRFLRISRFMVENFDVTDPGEVIGKTDFDFFTEEHARPAFEAEQQIIKTGEPLLNIEELETWEGRPSTWGLTSKLPLVDAHGEIVGTFGITRNIDELKHVQLTLERQSNQLQTTIDVARAISEILDPRELSQQIVDLIKERFDFYYVGLFLVNEPGDYAILRAGTGEAGRQMIEEEWQLLVGGDSMIGRCIQTGNPDIQLDIDQAPAHLRNPHLPDTQSEMALPLFSRGQVLGALTIQSSQPNAFTSEDTAVLQTMVNQISIALANAQLFEQTQNALLETETLLNVSRLASSTLGIEQALPQILDLILKATQVDAGLFSIVNPKTNTLTLSAHHLPEPLLRNFEANGLEGTLCHLVYQQRQPIFLGDLGSESPLDVTGLLNLGFQSYQGVPIETKGEILGTVCTFSKSRIQSEDSRINLLQAIGNQIGIAVDNYRLFEQTQATLARTSNLYTGSEKIVKAESVQAILEALVETTALNTMERVGLLIFDHPWDERNHPDGLTLTANWTPPGIEIKAPVGTYYKLSDYPLANLIGLREPVFIRDFLTASNIDENSRKYLLNILDSRSAISLPLVVSNQTIGGIVAFSNRILDINEDEIRQLTSLTDQATTVIQGLQLNEQTRAALTELEATQRRYQIQAWSAYNQARSNSGYQHTPDGMKPIGKQPIPQVKEAIEKQVPVISGNGEQPTLTVPILLRNQPIGAVGLRAEDHKHQWTPEEVTLVQEISEQFALAAESLRLLDETQRRAARERLVADITTKLRATNDPQAMLQTAAQELRTALHAQRAQALVQSNSPEDSGSENAVFNPKKRGES